MFGKTRTNQAAGMRRCVSSRHRRAWPGDPVSQRRRSWI